MGDSLNTKEIERELDTAIKSQRQALGLQRKLESELDKLDVTDRHYGVYVIIPDMMIR